MKDVEITEQSIELYKLLKFEGLASSGAEAKCAVAEGFVVVNDQVETRKRKKLVDGDIIEFGDETMRIRST